jgi:hypothetical protein
VARTSDHIALANRNQDALGFLLGEHTRFPEWITSIAFYKALHVVDAMLDNDGAPVPHDHRSRARILKSDRRYSNVYKHYHALWNASSVARYLTELGGKDYKAFADFLAADRVRADMVNHRLHQVEESALKLLGKAGAGLLRAKP